MSIVPYNSNNEIVFHDPTHKILVIHDNQENTILLVRALPFDQSEHEAFPRRSLEWPESERKCPHCGNTYMNSRRSNSHDYGRRQPSTSYHEPALGNYVSPAFMHNDYFKLLANLPFNDRSILLCESLPTDIFIQGYFERFFRKVPPGILGSGAHAQVYKVMHVLKNILLGIYAVKRINIGDYALYLDNVLNEVLILYELSVQGANENNLIRYNHVWMEMGPAKDLNTILLSEEGRALGLDDEVPYVYILQQYCDGGHLENLIALNFQKEKFMSAKERVEKERQKRRLKRKDLECIPQEPLPRRWLSDFEIWKFFGDIVNGVRYLHSRGILHRDLKPSNCLLEEKYVASSERLSLFSSLEALEEASSLLPKVLVSDFGEGKFIDKQHIADLSLDVDNERRGNTGTIEFTDPKLWVYSHYEGAGKKLAYEFTKSSDIYSLGMILCYLCLGCLPFEEEITDRNDPEKIRRDIANWHQQLLPESFHIWFSLNIRRVQGEFTDCLQDFEMLIYMLIEADGTFTAQNTMDFLAEMKLKRLVGSESRLAIIAEMIMDTHSKEKEPLLEGEVLDLTAPTRTSPTDKVKNSTWFSHEALAVLVCAANLILLEMITSSRIIRAAKVFSLVSLVVGAVTKTKMGGYLAYLSSFITFIILCTSWP